MSILCLPEEIAALQQPIEPTQSQALSFYCLTAYGHFALSVRRRMGDFPHRTSHMLERTVFCRHSVTQYLPPVGSGEAISPGSFTRKDKTSVSKKGLVSEGEGCDPRKNLKDLLKISTFLLPAAGVRKRTWGGGMWVCGKWSPQAAESLRQMGRRGSVQQPVVTIRRHAFRCPLVNSPPN
jgi:hypothetical protein